MHWLDKLIVFLTALVLVVLGIVILLTGLGVDFKQSILDLLFLMQQGNGLIASVVVGGFLVIIGLYLAGRYLGRDREEGFLATETEDGQIKIHNRVIVAYAEKAAKTVDGIVNVSTIIRHREDGLYIILDLITRANTKTSDIARVVQEKVLEYVADTIGTKVSKVEVNIVGVETPPKARLN